MVGSPWSCCVACFLLISSISQAHSQTQVDDELTFIVESHRLQDTALSDSLRRTPREFSGLRLFFTGGIKLYQMFISSQDLPVCRFTPSCSDFGLQAIRRYGVPRGILMTSDRLQRCHGFTHGHYPLDEVSGRSRDPVETYAPVEGRAHDGTLH